jgi:exonuclease III
MNNNDADGNYEYVDRFIACESCEADQFVEVTSPCLNKNINFLHLNINGCRTNFDEFRLYISSLSFNYAIIALTETNLNENNDFNFELNNYRSINHFTKHGLKIFYLNSLKVEVESSLNYNDQFKETLFIKIKSRALGYLLFGVVYRPHGASIQQFNESFQDCILNKLKPLDPVIMTGDFNINLLNSNISHDVQDFESIMYEANMSSSINKITRFNSICPLNSTIIDHYWSRIPFSYRTFVIKTNISDHYTICLHAELCNESELITVKFRDFSNVNIQTLLDRFPELIGELNLELVNPNQCMPTLLGWLNRIFSTFFPVKTKTLSLKRIKAPWITDTLLACIKKKHKFYSMFRNGMLQKEFYNRYKNLLTHAIRKSKQRYFQDSFISADKDASKMWKIIHNFMNNNKSSSIDAIRLPDSSVVKNPKIIASTFNESYVSVATNLRDNLPPNNGLLPFDNFPSNEQTIFLNPTNSAEVTEVINSFENKNNSLEDLPFKILKLIPAYLSPILADIFNLIINVGIYPDCLKYARVTPIFKNGDKLNPLNFRPISVLQSINKVFERLLFRRLDHFFQAFNIITSQQYGFTSNRGINDALFDLLGHIRSSLNANKHCLAIFCDFSKAFDTIDHNRLLMKLNRYGIRGVALELIKSYLSDRAQAVTVKNSISEYLPINHGVPQGSILGPWLFNAYVNDLSYYLRNNPPIQYADDTTMIDEDKDLDSLFVKVQITLNLFCDWSVVNYLSLNTKKTKYMLFSKNTPIGPMIPLTIRTDQLEQVNVIKFLGVHIDSKLNFKNQIINLRMKLARLVGLSYAIGPNMNIESAKSFYYGLVHSKLIFGVIFWGVAYATDVEPIQICQNKIIRNLFRDKIDYTSTSHLYSLLNILKFKDIKRLEACKAIYKALHSNSFIPFKNLLDDLDWNHQYQTRGIAPFRLPRVRSTSDKNDFLFQSVLYWNGLPNEIRSSSSLYVFKKSLQSRLLLQYGPQ